MSQILAPGSFFCPGFDLHWSVALVNHAKAVQRDVSVDGFDEPRSPADQRSKPAGSHRASAGTEFLHHSLQNSVYESDVAIVEPGLDAPGSVGSDYFVRTPNLCVSQSRGVLEQR